MGVEGGKHRDVCMVAMPSDMTTAADFEVVVRAALLPLLPLGAGKKGGNWAGGSQSDIIMTLSLLPHPTPTTTPTPPLLPLPSSPPLRQQAADTT